ncbi:MAG: RNA polymerase sigma factor [Planctomycetota bacterium]|jgi:RNA polymerase sigma-70 factor (ECF subfamily)
MEPDEKLIELANKGDAEAFETLYYRYRDWVYHLAWRFTGNQADALDVLQETFVYLLKKFPGFQLTASMTTFLYPAVKHISLTIRRRSRPHVSADEVLREIAASASKDTPDVRTELAAVLRGLPAEQREILLMRFVDDMSMEEIANALNIPLGTVKSRLHNALHKLRQDHRARDYFLE